MRIGYLIDSNLVHADRRPLTPAEIADGLDAMVEEGVLAERAGFHSVHAPDRHGAPACAFPGPEQLLTLLARETARVMLGTFTFVDTLVHPMKAAEQFAVIDNLSRGRLVTTVSRGFLPQFWGQYGIPEEQLLGRFLEALRVWRAAFEGERFDFDGDHWEVRDGCLAPAPFQEGGWPIWSGGNASPAAIRRSATFGEAWTCDPMPHAREAFLADAGAYRERAEELGKQPFVVLMRDGWVADSFDEAARGVRRALRADDPLLPAPRATSRATRASPRRRRSRPRASRPTSSWASRSSASSTSSACTRSFGVDYVVLLLPAVHRTRRWRRPASRSCASARRSSQPIHARYPAPDHPAIPAACRW